MTTRVGLVSVAIIAILALQSAPSGATDVTLTGIVSDAACGIDHHGRDREECTRSCAEESGQYVLVIGSRIYTLVAEDDMRAKIYDLAGHPAIVTGDRQSGDVVTVKSVKAPPARRRGVSMLPGPPPGTLHSGRFDENDPGS